MCSIMNDQFVCKTFEEGYNNLMKAAKTFVELNDMTELSNKFNTAASVLLRNNCQRIDVFINNKNLALEDFDSGPRNGIYLQKFQEISVPEFNYKVIWDFDLGSPQIVKKEDMSGGAKRKYMGRTYKVRTGSRGGHYIVVGKDKKKVYV